MADMVVDTNYWVAAAIEGDKNHQEAVQFVQELTQKNDKCHLPYTVLVETCRVLIRKAREKRTSPRIEVIKVKDLFSQLERRGLLAWYPLDLSSADEMVNLLMGQDFKLGDVALLSLALRHGYEFKSFESELNKAFRHFKEYRPKVSQ